ncbi:endosialin-like [Carcharodon carcharias]|uniref:endosialin-like n=1 Tax=Carcharodon carcharias TaxID=13397 RepID=UPI001B7E2153|nr:endosialin-like [Carcharodon carcharias]
MWLLGLAMLCLWPAPAGQESVPVGAVCGPEACYTAHLQRRSFSDAWRACRELGGNLASLKRPEEAGLVEELLVGLPVGEERGLLKLWLGLQRQPRQCSPHKALRGFTWMTGDQDTWYTNWLRAEHPGSCPAARCVVLSYGAGESGRYANYKWLDGSCLLAVDGYLCRFAYRGMCQRIEPGAGETVAYATPFGVTSTRLRHVPFGSVATVSCGAPLGAQSLLCMARGGEGVSAGEERGSGVTWSRDPPYCQGSQPRGWCAVGNGGCQHACLDEGAFYHCRCREGYRLGEDGRSCAPPDGCPGGYRREGGECRDADECLSGPCAAGECVNTEGSYLCRCPEGYRPEGSECLDVDECLGTPCDQLCANTEGSYQCYCQVGFTLSEEDAVSCSDVDECQYQGTCQQMCVNYLGRYECHCEEGYVLDPDGFSCHPHPLPERPPTRGSGPTSPATEGVGDRTRGVTPTPSGEPGGRPLPVTEAGPGERLEGDRAPSAPPEETRRAVSAGEPGPPDRGLGQPVWRSRELPGREWTSTTTTTTDKAAGAGSSPAPTAGGIETGPPDRGLGQPVWRSRELPGREWTSTTTTDKAAGAGSSPAPTAGGIEPGPPDQGLGQPVWRSRELPGREWTSTTTTDKAAGAGSSPAPTAGGIGAPAPVPTAPPPDTQLTTNASGGPNAHRHSRQRRDDRWLLMALLVPICVFVVVMLALAIVYCTRCACGRTRNITDCYRWIHNSSKAAAPDANPTNMNTTVWEPQASGQFPSIWRTDVTHL